MGVIWPVYIRGSVRPEDRKKELIIDNVKRRLDNENEYKMHIKRKAGEEGMKGGKLIFDDKTLGETWREIILTQARLVDSERQAAHDLKPLMDKVVTNLFNDIEKQIFGKDDSTEKDDIYLCSVDKSNRCILYKRAMNRERMVVENYLYYTSYTDTETVENPLEEDAKSQGGGKKTKKRKRKTNKRKYKGRKRSSRNYKSKNKKYTKRRR